MTDWERKEMVNSLLMYAFGISIAFVGITAVALNVIWIIHLFKWLM